MKKRTKHAASHTHTSLLLPNNLPNKKQTFLTRINSVLCWYSLAPLPTSAIQFPPNPQPPGAYTRVKNHCSHKLKKYISKFYKLKEVKWNNEIYEKKQVDQLTESSCVVLQFWELESKAKFKKFLWFWSCPFLGNKSLKQY